MEIIIIIMLPLYIRYKILTDFLYNSNFVGIN